MLGNVKQVQGNQRAVGENVHYACIQVSPAEGKMLQRLSKERCVWTQKSMVKTLQEKKKKKENKKRKNIREIKKVQKRDANFWNKYR
jgi:hypothetical protein